MRASARSQRFLFLRDRHSSQRNLGHRKITVRRTTATIKIANAVSVEMFCNISHNSISAMVYPSLLGTAGSVTGMPTVALPPRAIICCVIFFIALG